LSPDAKLLSNSYLYRSILYIATITNIDKRIYFYFLLDLSD